MMRARRPLGWADRAARNSGRRYSTELMHMHRVGKGNARLISDSYSKTR